MVDGSSLESAQASNDIGQWVIRPVFREGPDGIGRFNVAAEQCDQKTDVCPTGQLAIVVDGTVISGAEHQPVDVPTGPDPDLRQLHGGQRVRSGDRLTAATGSARGGLQDLERFADALAVNRFLASVQP